MPAKTKVAQRKAAASALEVPAPAQASPREADEKRGSAVEPKLGVALERALPASNGEAERYTAELEALLEPLGLERHLARIYGEREVVGFKSVGRRKKDRRMVLVWSREGEALEYEGFGELRSAPCVARCHGGRELWAARDSGSELGRLVRERPAPEWTAMPLESAASVHSLYNDNLLVADGELRRLCELVRDGDDWTIRRWWHLPGREVTLLDDGKTLFAIRGTTLTVFAIDESGMRPLAWFRGPPDENGDEPFLRRPQGWRGGVLVLGPSDYFFRPELLARMHAQGASQPLWPEGVEFSEGDGDQDEGDEQDAEDEGDEEGGAQAEDAPQDPALVDDWEVAYERADALWEAREFEACLAWYARVAVLRPAMAEAVHTQYLALVELGRAAEAQRLIEPTCELYRARLARIERGAAMEEESGTAADCCLWIAALHALGGEPTRALEWVRHTLERDADYRQRFVDMADFEALREVPEFVELTRKKKAVKKRSARG